jgi:hypothetical protein
MVSGRMTLSLNGEAEPVYKRALAIAEKALGPADASGRLARAFFLGVNQSSRDLR